MILAIQDTLSITQIKSWDLLNYSVKRKCCVVLPLVKKTRDLAVAVLTGIFLYQTKRIQDILTNIELRLITLFQLIVDKPSKTD